MAQAVKHKLCNYEAWSSNPRTCKKEKKITLNRQKVMVSWAIICQ